MITPGGGCELATVTRCRIAWGKFNELLPLLCSRSLSLHTRGRVFVTYVRSALLHASECWALKKEDLLHLERNERSMLRWMLNFRVEEKISLEKMYNMVGVPSLSSSLRLRRLRWFGHTMRSSGWINRISNLKVSGKAGKGRPPKSWSEVVKEDLKKWNIPVDIVEDRIPWRSSLKMAMAKSNPSMYVKKTINGW